MAYIPLSDVVGGLGSGFSGASRDIMAIQQARQLAEQRRQAMDLAKQEEVRAQAEEQRRQAAEAAKSSIRPLDLAASQYALRGQLLGTVETPEDYARIMPTIEAAGLPTQDLPEQRKSEAWRTFAQKPAPSALPAWLPQKWVPAGGPQLPAPTYLPDKSMQLAGISPEEIGTSVRRAAERGLPILQQSKTREGDFNRTLRAAELQSRETKYQTQLELARQAAELQRMMANSTVENRRQDQAIKEKSLGIDYAKLDLAKKESENRAATTPKFTADQTNAATYGRRVEAGLSDLDRIGASGYDPTTVVNSGTIYALVTGTPGAKIFAGPEARQTAQGYRNIINAILRRESGAAIAPSEFDNAQQQYFPALNDDPGTLAQKRRNLKQAMAGLKTGAGAAWDATPQVTAKPVAPPSAPQSSMETRTHNGATYTRKAGSNDLWRLVK